jgi:hypothetical protein
MNDQSTDGTERREGSREGDARMTDGKQRISNYCHICDTNLVWDRETERSFCPECNPQLLRDQDT